MNNGYNLTKNMWIHWDMTGDEILNSTKMFITRSLQNNRKLLELDLTDNENLPTFINLLADDISEFLMYHSLCSFLQFVSPNRQVRTASYESDILLTKYAAELNIRKNLYDKISLFLKIIKSVNFSKEDVKFVEKVLDGFKKNGVLLSEDAKVKLIKVRSEIIKLENSISYDLHKFDNKLVGLLEDELVGLPNRYKMNLQLINNTPLRFGILLDKFNYVNCMRFIKDPDVRRKLELCYASKSFDIIEDISKLIILRDKHAQLLGVENHSQFKNVYSTLETPSHIKKTVMEVIKVVDKKYDNEINTLVKLNSGEQINSWDLQYFIYKWKKEYDISDSYVRQFFPLKHVVTTILEMYQSLFKLKFTKILHAHVWHPSVSMYSVHSLNNILLGYFYLDLYGRKDKYKNTRCFCLQFSCQYPMSENTRQLPIAALITSITKLSKKVTLLNYSEVVSLFHEFGHVLHHILGYSKYSLFSGTHVEADFIETPAQALEYLCWEKDVIRKLSKHYRTKQQLPDDKINKMVKIRDLELGLHIKKHGLIALYDQVIHSSNTFIKMCESYFDNLESRKENLSVAFATVYKQLHNEIFSKIGFNNGILFPGLWLNYLVGGDGQYYSHIWSKVCAANIYYKYKDDLDIFGSVMKDGVLKKGGTMTANEIMLDVLDEMPNILKFAKLHDIEVEEEYSYYLQTDQIKNVSTTELELEVEETEYSNRFSEINPDSIY